MKRNLTGVMTSTIPTPSVPAVDATFVEIVGRLDLNKLAAFGSAMLADNDS